MDTMIDTRTLRLVRMFDAPRERVFAAWTDRTSSCNGCARPASGSTNARSTCGRAAPGASTAVHDRRSTFSPSRASMSRSSGPSVWSSPGPTMPMTDYASPRGHETTVRVELRALGDKTELTLVHGPFADTPSLANHEQGWKGSFDKLSGFLGSASWPSRSTDCRPAPSPARCGWAATRRASTTSWSRRCRARSDALNPFRKIPAITHGELTLYESTAILRYFDRAFPGPKLWPEDVAAAAMCDQWASAVCDSLVNAALRYIAARASASCRCRRKWRRNISPRRPK